MKNEKSDFNGYSIASAATSMGLTTFNGRPLKIFSAPSSDPPDPDTTTLPTQLLLNKGN